jgi:hypothetical protein
MDKHIEIITATRGTRGEQTKNILYKMFSPLENKGYVKMTYIKMKNILATELKGELCLYDGNMNCEHVWPQSFFKKKYPMKSDMNQCFLTNSRLNNHRNSYSFFEFDFKFNDVNKEHIDTSGKPSKKGVNPKTLNPPSENSSNKCNYDRTFEPRDVSKGKIARAIAYFNTMYPEYDISKIIDVQTMLKWHKDDPVDESEQLRTEVVYKHQRNLNPYIVCPELMEIVYPPNTTNQLTIKENIVLLKKQLERFEKLLEYKTFSNGGKISNKKNALFC